jgi:hypothetical protein
VYCKKEYCGAIGTQCKFQINGYYRIGFFFDFDLKVNLVKYNDYDSFRLGTGGFTNYKFSQYFKLGGYVAREDLRIVKQNIGWGQFFDRGIHQFYFRV